MSRSVRRLQDLALLANWTRAERAGGIDPRIPHPGINFNRGRATTVGAYVSGFTERAQKDELPALLEIAGFTDSDDHFVLLDYGCGLGRLGYAFTERFDHDERRRYIGYEIEPDAVAFLRSAYAGYSNVSILSDQLRLSDSYIEIQQPDKTSTGGIAAESVHLAARLDEPVNLVFSHSVFTHMYREPILHVLKEMRAVIATDGLCVNTWLLVDEEAASNLASGRADRKLPFAGDGFRTYDEENPLACTAYDIEVARSLYNAAGHEIADIRFGSWSGRKPRQDFTYQDVVISRAKG